MIRHRDDHAELRRLRELFDRGGREIERLRASEDTLRLLVENSTDMLSRHDAGGGFTWVSPSALEILGYDPDELCRLAPADLLHPEDVPSYGAAHTAARLSGEVGTVTYRMRHGAGRWIWLSSTLRAVRGGGGIPVHVQAASRDVTMPVRTQYGQGALHRIAAALVREVSEEALFALCAHEVLHLLDTESAVVARYQPGGALVLASDGGAVVSPGQVVPDGGDGALARTRRSAASERVDYRELGADDPLRHLGVAERYACGASVPVYVRGTLWGALLATARHAGTMPAEAELWLSRIAELMGLGIAAAAQRTQLRAQATTDALTGLANHRAFHERLRSEIARSHRSGAPMSLVLVDIDRFKQINDAHGHQVGDQVLRVFADILAEHARGSDLAARLGGEEFALLLVDTDAEGATVTAERLRRTVAEARFPGAGHVTASFGLAGLEDPQGPDELLRNADVALYAAKSGGRNRCAVHDAQDAGRGPTAIDHSGHDTVAGRALRALARTTESECGAASGHSERVAVLAVALATALGWGAEATSRLRDAALVHEVAGAVVSDVLAADQAEWIRMHRRRWDGRGRGRAAGPGGEAIPEGARIIALADAWDTLRTEHGDDHPATADETLRRVRRRSGRHYWPAGVEALARLAEIGALPRHAPGQEQHVRAA